MSVRAHQGQAAVELVAVLPIAGRSVHRAVAAGVAGDAWRAAAGAADASARAAALGEDPTRRGPRRLPAGLERGVAGPSRGRRQGPGHAPHPVLVRAPTWGRSPPGHGSHRSDEGRDAASPPSSWSALLPLLLAVGLAVLSLLQRRRSAEQAAGGAAEAGAVALLQGRDPRAAARAALAGWPARRAAIAVRGPAA